jgi:hypothetical protein
MTTVSHGRADLPSARFGPEIELRMIGLPELVRPFGLAAMSQVVGLAIGLLAIQGEGLQIFRDGANQLVDRVISRRLFPSRPRDAANLPVSGTGAKRGALQGETFGEPEQIFRDMPLAPI